MSLGDATAKVVAIVLLVIGLCLVLAAFGLNLIGVHAPVAWWLEALIGLLLIGAGLVVLRGGAITL